MMLLVNVLVLVVGAPLLAVAGAALSCSSTRRAVGRRKDAFPCKVRALDKPALGIRTSWPRRTAQAVWVHDALVVVTGRFRARVRPLPVHFVEGDVCAPSEDLGQGLGRDPVVLALRLDDGQHVLLAAAQEARSLVAGPYLVAELGYGKRTRKTTPDQP